MSKFYRKLPEVITNILSISNGWLIGSSIENLLNNETPNDYDIIIPQENYRIVYNFIKRDNPEFNTHGGLKVIVDNNSIDIWIDTLDRYIQVALEATYAYNFSKDKLIKIE